MGGLVFVGAWRLWGRSRGWFDVEGKVVVVGYDGKDCEGVCLYRNVKMGKVIRCTVHRSTIQSRNYYNWIDRLDSTHPSSWPKFTPTPTRLSKRGISLYFVSQVAESASRG